MAGDIAREHDIAGPEQRSQAEQQVGLVVEPAERGMMLRLGGQCGRICAGMGELSKVARRIGDMRSATHSLSSRRKPGSITTGRSRYAYLPPPSCPGLSRASTPVLACCSTWMAGTSPAMTRRAGDLLS